MSETQNFLQSNSTSSNPGHCQHERLLHAVTLMEEILYVRWLTLGTEEGHKEERDAMTAVADDLLSIKIHKLGWPDLGRH
jgi:hypothetical protein